MKWKKGFWITKMFPFDCVIKNLIELFIRGGLIREKKFYHPFSITRVLGKTYAKSSHCYLDWISSLFSIFVWLPVKRQDRRFPRKCIRHI